MTLNKVAFDEKSRLKSNVYVGQLQLSKLARLFSKDAKKKKLFPYIKSLKTVRGFPVSMTSLTNRLCRLSQ